MNNMAFDLVPKEELIPRDDLAELARSEGMDITTRTLRYWAQRGWIPHPWRLDGEGHRAFYPKSLLERLRVLSAMRPGRLKKIRDNIGDAETIQFGEDSFQVLPALVRWEREGTEFSARVLADGSGMLLIRKKRGQETLRGSPS